MTIKVIGARTRNLGLVINIWNISEGSPAFEVAGLAKATNELGRAGHVVNVTNFTTSKVYAKAVKVTGYIQDTKAILEAAKQSADEVPFGEAEKIRKLAER